MGGFPPKEKRMDEERAKQVMVRAQLDLIAAVKYALTVYDIFDTKAAIRTTMELAKFTGEEIGKELYHLVEER